MAVTRVDREMGAKDVRFSRLAGQLSRPGAACLPDYDVLESHRRVTERSIPGVSHRVVQTFSTYRLELFYAASAR